MGSNKHISKEQFIQRFWSYVNIKEPDECWLWVGNINPGTGYGRISFNGRTHSAHRFCYELMKEPIPKGLCVCHSCDVRNCVNPDHLWVGTNIENILDMVSKRRHAFGDRSGLRLHPEKRSKGDKNGSRLHPEKLERGEQRYNAKLTTKQILEIRRRYATGEIGKRRLAREYGVAKSTLSAIINRARWKHVA